MENFKELPEEVENYRDRRWRREETLKTETALQVEAMVGRFGFCLALTDARTNPPSVVYRRRGRRDAHAPKNVQKDYEMSLACDAQRRSDDARQSLLRQTLQRSRDVRRAATRSLFQRDLGRAENARKKRSVGKRE